MKFLLSFLLLAQLAYSQKVGISNNEDIEWKASWIWLHEQDSSDVLLTRKSFSLKDQPSYATINITASSQYQLFVNGKYVSRGPARCAPHHQSFDTFEINHLLKNGQNLIAVRVHYQKGKTSYHLAERPGLLVQINTSDEVIISDESWKVSPDFSWDKNAPPINRFQDVVVDRVDFRKVAKGWETVAFNDTHWQNAIALLRSEGWPSVTKDSKPHHLTNPWTSLIPRDIPYLLEGEIIASKLIEAHPTTSTGAVKLTGVLDQHVSEDFKRNNENETPFLIKSQPDYYFLLFDLGIVYNAFPQLVIEGQSGTEVEILKAPFIIDSLFDYNVVFSNSQDLITLSGEIDTWEATYFKPTRYLALRIPKTKQTIKIHKVGIRYMKYPFELKGAISSPDATWVNDYMDATAKTIYACTTDAYTDNYREKRQYAQTGYYASLGNYWLFGDSALQRRYLLQIAQEQEANGIMPAYAPSKKNDYMVILDSNCFWIRSLRNYLLYTGDKKTVFQLLPSAKELMNLLHSFTNELGLIYNPPYAYWLDHSLNDRNGANFTLNAHYLGALLDFSEVLKWLEQEDFGLYNIRAELLKISLQQNFWNDEKGLFADAYIDGEQSTMFSEHANAMALALHISNQNQANLIASQLLKNDELNYINRSNGMTMVTPAMSYFLHKGLCEARYIKESFQLFRKRFNKMLSSNGNGTLYEEWWLNATSRTGKLQKTSRSDAQTESAFAPALFGEYILGIQPTKPGWLEASLTFQNCGIEEVKGTVPTPQGLLVVNWDFAKGSLEIDIPKGIAIDIDLNSFKKNDFRHFKRNGKSVKKSKISLYSGKQYFEFN